MAQIFCFSFEGMLAWLFFSVAWLLQIVSIPFEVEVFREEGEPQAEEFPETPQVDVKAPPRVPQRFVAGMHYSSVGDTPFPTFGEGFLVFAKKKVSCYFWPY